MWMLIAAAAAAAIATAALAYALVLGGLERYQRWQGGVEERMRRDFRQSHIDSLTPEAAARGYCLSLVVLPAFSLLVLQSVTSAVAVVAMIVLIPRSVLSYLRQTRISLVEEQLPAALDQIGRSIGAGLSLAQAIDEVAESAPAPVCQEFTLISKDHALGSSMADAITLARSRLRSRQFDLVATALLVSIDKGGDLRNALGTISASLKEIWRLEQRLLTASSEGRKAMLVISVVPLFVLLLVAFLQPELASTLTSSVAGIAILAVAVLMYGGGLLWLRRILATEI